MNNIDSEGFEFDCNIVLKRTYGFENESFDSAFEDG